MIRHSRHHNIDSAIMYGFAVLAVLLLSNIQKPYFYIQEKIIPQSSIEQKRDTTSIYNQKAFSDVKIKGKAYIVYDVLDQKIIAEKNANTVLPIASITKVMTLVTARMHHDRNKLVTITSKSLDGKGYDLGLKNGQVWKLDELLKYTLVLSSNDGSQAIADTLGGRATFVSQMNKDAEILGLTLHFTHPSGLDEGNKIGGEGSALSVAKLLVVARKYFPEILDATTKTRVSVTASNGRISGIPNTNQNVYNLSGLEASKTGFTDLAGGNLAVVVDISVGRPVVIVVLGSTTEERFSDVEKLYKALQNSIKK